MKKYIAAATALLITSGVYGSGPYLLLQTAGFMPQCFADTSGYTTKQIRITSPITVRMQNVTIPTMSRFFVINLDCPYQKKPLYLQN